MYKVQPGSVLLIVVFVSALLLIGMTSVWRATHFFYESTYMRRCAHQAQYSAQACMYRAIAICWSNFHACYDLLSAQQEILVLHSSAWSFDGKRTCQSRVYAQRKGADIQLRTELMDNNTVIWNTRCVCTDKAVTQWSDMRG